MEQEFFTERYRKLGWEYRDVSVKKAIRVNTLRISKDALISRLASKGVSLKKSSLSKDGFTVDSSNFSVGSSVEYLLGYFYVQEAASQVPAELLGPKPEDTVLDCCAAPGGKTTQLSQLMENKGVVVALDKDSRRLIALKNNLERMGCSNSAVYNADALNAHSLGINFDKVLLDAPCSGNFTHQENWFGIRDIGGIRGNAERQKKLLESCFNVLRPGGKLVYSTCSLEPEENEENAQWFKENFSVKLVEQRRIWPSEESQGFFAAKFIRKK